MAGLVLRNEVSEFEVELSVTGPLRGTAVAEFNGLLRMLATKAYRLITISLRECEAINSAAIGIIISVMKSLAPERALRLTGCSASLYAKLKALRLDSLIEISGRERN